MQNAENYAKLANGIKLVLRAQRASERSEPSARSVEGIHQAATAHKRQWQAIAWGDMCLQDFSLKRASRSLIRQVFKRGQECYHFWHRFLDRFWARCGVDFGVILGVIFQYLSIIFAWSFKHRFRTDFRCLRGRFLAPSEPPNHVFTTEKQGFLRFHQVWQSIRFPKLFIIILGDFCPLLAHIFVFWGHQFSVWC